MWENYLNEYFKLVLLSLKKRGRVWRSIKNEVCGHPNQYPWHLNKKSKLTELQMNSSSGPFSIKFILLLGFSWWFAVNIFIASIDPLQKEADIHCWQEWLAVYNHSVNGQWDGRGCPLTLPTVLLLAFYWPEHEVMLLDHATSST